MRVQLLCTFSDPIEVESTTVLIKKRFVLPDKKIFVFRDAKNHQSLLLTYNIDPMMSSSRIKSTISIHRKKQTNTLFTLNALNKIIEEENGGKIDPKFQIDWELYRDCLILTYETGYRIFDIELQSIVKI